jgi:hypothetical protein
LFAGAPKEDTMNTRDSSAIVLYRGSHSEEECAQGKRCLFEAFNWLTRQQNTDQRPPGVSPVLHVMGMRLNDCLPDTKRQHLAVLLPNGTSPLAGTEHDGLDHTRSLLALDWLIRVHAPAFLDLVPVLAPHAAALRDLPAVTLVNAAAAGAVVRAARPAAWAAAGAAAGGALNSVVDRLQDSAIRLYHTMINPQEAAS